MRHKGSQAKWGQGQVGGKKGTEGEEGRGKGGQNLIGWFGRGFLGDGIWPFVCFRENFGAYRLIIVLIRRCFLKLSIIGGYF